MKIRPVGAELLQGPVTSSHLGSAGEGGGGETGTNHRRSVGPSVQTRAQRATMLHVFISLGSIRCN